jgi:hypothetical protein
MNFINSNFEQEKVFNQLLTTPILSESQSHHVSEDGSEHENIAVG